MTGLLRTKGLRRLSQAGVLDRFNHTGTQAIATVDGLATALTGKVSYTDLGDSDGSQLVGFIRAGTGAVLRTIEQELLADEVKSTQYTTLQQALNAAAGRTLRISGTHTITSELLPESNTDIILDRDAVVQTSTPNISLFLVSGKTNVHIKGGKIKQTVAGNLGNKAGVYFANSTNCTAEATEYEGMQWAAVFMQGCLNVHARFNYVHDSLNSIGGDKFDIVMFSSYNCTADFNILWGGQFGGVLIQDPLGSGINVPSRNKARYNKVGSPTIACKVYGIVVYLGGTNPTYNDVIGNHVENVLGDPAAQLDTGTGIYFVGSGLGGSKCLGNTVVNACQMTSSTSNGPAGITIADTISSALPVEVSGNTVDGMTRWSGILLVNCDGVEMGPNTVRLTSANTGANLGHALNIFNSKNVNATGGRYIHEGNGDAILVNTTAFDVDTINLTGMSVKSATQNGIRTNQVGGYKIRRLNVVGITGNAATACSINDCDLSTFTSINIDATASYGWSITNTTNSLLETCIMEGLSYSLFTNGTCTNTRVGISNILIGPVENNATGLIVTRYGTAAPIAPNVCQRGDTTVNSLPSLGSAEGWTCITAGGPGTHEETGIVGAVRATTVTVTYGAPATTYAAPTGGATIDAESRAAIVQLAADAAAAKATLAQLAADNADLRSKLAAANLTA